MSEHAQCALNQKTQVKSHAVLLCLRQTKTFYRFIIYQVNYIYFIFITLNGLKRNDPLFPTKTKPLFFIDSPPKNPLFGVDFIHYLLLLDIYIQVQAIQCQVYIGLVNVHKYLSISYYIILFLFLTRFIKYNTT